MMMIASSTKMRPTCVSSSPNCSPPAHMSSSHRDDRDRHREGGSGRRRHSRDRDRGGKDSRDRDDSRERRPRHESHHHYQQRRDRSGHSPSTYDAQYESRRFRDRRDRERTEKYARRSRSRETTSRRGGGGDRDRDTSSRRHHSYYSDDSREARDQQERRAPPMESESNEVISISDQSQQRREKTESEYLSKMSDEKLQESYDRYQTDPTYDITDGLLDNIVIDKEKIQAEMQERLRQHLLAEGKVYPPRRPEPPPQTTAFANDGSFMDMFKRMQQESEAAAAAAAADAAQTEVVADGGGGVGVMASGSGVNRKAAAAAATEVRRAVGPMFGKRRGGKILKTGIVEKKKPIEDLSADAAPGDAWSQYMKEVKRYKAVSCDVDNKNRPLVK